MHKIILTFICSLFYFNFFAQLFQGTKKMGEYYVEIKNDSAFIEVFFISPISELPEETQFDTLLINKNSTNKLYTGNKSSIEKSKEEFILLFTIKEKVKKVKLKSDFNNQLGRLRKEAYLHKKILDLYQYEDSLSGPDNFLSVNFEKSFREIDKYSNSLEEYSIKVDSIKALTKQNIFNSRDIRIDSIYKSIQSLEISDSEDAFYILRSTDYKFSYGKDLIFALSKSKPEIMINYLDTEPENKKNLLNAIRDHNEFIEIIANVKKVESESDSKKEIIKQEIKRNKADKRVGFIYGSIIVAEIGLLTALVVWFATRL